MKKSKGYRVYGFSVVMAMGVIITASVAYLAIATYQSRQENQKEKQAYLLSFVGTYCSGKNKIELKKDGIYNGKPEVAGHSETQRVSTNSGGAADPGQISQESGEEIKEALKLAIYGGRWFVETDKLILKSDEGTWALKIEGNQLLDESGGFFYEKC